MPGVTCHILGAGLAQNPENHIFRTRLDAVKNIPDTDKVIVYGRQQPGNNQSEADSGVAYLKDLLGPTGPRLIANAIPKSISETMRLIAQQLYRRHIAEGTSSAYGPVPYPCPHVVVINWPYLPRTRYLLRKQWQRLHPDTPWSHVARFVTFQPVGGTFWPSWQVRGLKTLVWWPWKVLTREILATLKSRLDPYDTKINQKREASKIF